MKFEKRKKRREREDYYPQVPQPYQLGTDALMPSAAFQSCLLPHPQTHVRKCLYKFQNFKPCHVNISHSLTHL